MISLDTLNLHPRVENFGETVIELFLMHLL